MMLEPMENYVCTITFAPTPSRKDWRCHRVTTTHLRYFRSFLFIFRRLCQAIRDILNITYIVHITHIFYMIYVFRNVSGIHSILYKGATRVCTGRDLLKNTLRRVRTRRRILFQFDK